MNPTLTQTPNEAIMSRIHPHRLIAAACGLIFAGAALAVPPVVTAVVDPSLAHTDRLLINGSGFGLPLSGAHVEIDGVTAPFTRWTNTLISAYLPATTALGAHQVRVVNTDGTSNSVSITVLPTVPPTPHVRWRFMADSDRIESRPVLAPDGTIYLQDRDNLYSLTPAGGVNWIFRAENSAYYGRLDRAPDGTLYAGFGNKVFAVNPDGTQRWVVADPSGSAIFAGPNVGPDGNIYAVTQDFASNATSSGLGLFSVTPTGTIRWNRTGFANRFGYHGEPILFADVAGSPRLFFTTSALGGRSGSFFSFDLDGSVRWERLASGYPTLGPGGELYAFTNGGPPPQMTRFDPASGNTIWNHAGTNAFNSEAGPDGTLYCGLTMYGGIEAVSRDNALRWSRDVVNPATGSSAFIYEPAVSAQNHMLLLSGYSIAEPGFFAALNPANGATRWTVTLPEEGVFVWPGVLNRPRFTPDGRTAYFGTSRADYSTSPYSYLYALDTSDGLPASCPADFNHSGAASVQDIFDFLSAYFSGNPAADVNASGAVSVQDIFDFLAAYFAGCP
jgi:hypothetical protein